MSEPLGLEPLPLPPLPTPGALFHLVRSGLAASRADLARLTGLSASTVAGRVEDLVAAGLLEESGQGESRGGRRPRRLRVRSGDRVLVGVDLGERHASYAVLDRQGAVVADGLDAVSLADGPEAVVRAVVARSRELVAGVGDGSLVLGGIAMGLPGPVDSRTGRLVSPSRMPGWNGVAVRGLLEERSGLPARVENDANAMALGEFAHRGGQVRELVYVKAGTGIGCGVVLDGRLYRGFRGVAGDISHTAVAGAPPVPCSCGRAGCLDVVASGSAVLDALRADGVHVADMPGLLAIASDAHPRATRLLREAGTRTGEVLAAIVNVLNPQALVLGGALSRSEAFVAGVRQAIYAQCLPMATDLLDLSVSEAGWLAGATGVGRSLLDDLLHPALVDAALRDGVPVSI
ncbi:ROK family transcriptional regulator [Cellulomonas triticagri]|uniref:ROK family transcriptional regulator n=1 Tax=Cellulomonas triticagri TaxID=2483352 RepID=A0A3M2JPP3_9CELL|nr:ROK family transcriptional regulator [Cellulomonas triticagri]RMI12695.1 ROK family transcriptional regulator [Cellulomonas triticagri]